MILWMDELAPFGCRIGIGLILGLLIRIAGRDCAERIIPERELIGILFLSVGRLPLAKALGGGVVALWVFGGLYRLFGREGIGGGDGKLMLAAGPLLGPWDLVYALFLAGSTAFFAVVCKGGAKGTRPFAFGPFLAFGIGTILVFGEGT